MYFFIANLQDKKENPQNRVYTKLGNFNMWLYGEKFCKWNFVHKIKNPQNGVKQNRV